MIFMNNGYFIGYVNVELLVFLMIICGYLFSIFDGGNIWICEYYLLGI